MIKKSLSKTYFFLRFIYKSLLLFFVPVKPRKFLHENVTCFPQWESSELVKKILDKEMSAIDDPKWRESGGADKKEYLHWSWSCCGMACFKMILKEKTGETVPTIVLGKKCMEYGGYDFDKEAYLKDDIENSLSGLKYRGFVDFVRDEYKFDVKAVPVLTMKEIFLNLSKKKFIIASVSPSIRDYKNEKPNNAKHLVFLLGYDLDKNIIYLHNPSGFPDHSQEYFEINIDVFRKYYNWRGAIIS